MGAAHPKVVIIVEGRDAAGNAGMIKRCITHVLGQFPHHEVEHSRIERPKCVFHRHYVRHPVPPAMMVPEVF